MERAHLRLLPPLKPINGETPPHDLDAEGACLSDAMLDQRAATKLAEILDDPKAFYSDPNGKIWTAILALLASKVPIDSQTVASYLHSHGQLVAVGGIAYLIELCDKTPSVANVAAHGRIVHDCWRRRQAIAACQRIAAEGYGVVENVQQFLDDAADVIAGLARSSKSDDGPRMLSEAFAETMADMVGFTPGLMSGYSTGLVSLDELTGGTHGGEIVLLKAKRKVGKSALCGQLCATIAGQPKELPEDPARPGVKRRQWRGALILALEGKRKDWSSRMACAHGRVDYSRIRTGTADADDLVRMTSASNALSSLPILIDDRKDLTPAKLVSRVRAARDRFASKGAVLSMVVLDNMQLWPTPPNDRRDRRVVLDEAMQTILQLAADEDLQDVAWIVVSQINNDGDAKDCKALEAHADALWSLSAEAESTADNTGAVIARVTVEAQRRGPQGKNAPMWFYPRYTFFWDR